jgi:predicted metalloprotease
VEEYIMRLDDQNESDNVEDRRGGGIGRGSVGIGTLVIALAAGYFFGIDPALILGLASNTSAPPAEPAGPQATACR